MLSKKEKEAIRSSDYDTLIQRKEYLESVMNLLKEVKSHTYKGYNIFDTQKELSYILDVLAFDFTPRRSDIKS